MQIYSPPHKVDKKSNVIFRYNYGLYIGSDRIGNSRRKQIINENIYTRRRKFLKTRLRRKRGIRVCPVHAHISWFFQMFIYEGKYPNREILKICRRKYIKTDKNKQKICIERRAKINSLRRMKIKLGTTYDPYL